MNIVSSTAWSNEDWLQGLSGKGPHAQVAQEALHLMLCHGLRRAFSSRPNVLNWIEDFAQETALYILRDLPTFRGDSHFTTWALSIAVRVSFDEMRRKRWSDVSLDSLVESGNQPHLPQLRNQEKEIARQRAFLALRQAISSQLTERQRLALTAELNEMPQSEIARQLGTTRNAVYKLTHDARKTLKRVLNEAGITAEMIGWVFASDQRSLR